MFSRLECVYFPRTVQSMVYRGLPEAAAGAETDKLGAVDAAIDLTRGD